MRGGSGPLRWVLAGIGVALLCLVTTTWVLSRVLSPTTAQRTACDALQTPLPVSGRDAFLKNAHEVRFSKSPLEAV
jgi:hypothetical protein